MVMLLCFRPRVSLRGHPDEALPPPRRGGVQLEAVGRRGRRRGREAAKRLGQV